MPDLIEARFLGIRVHAVTGEQLIERVASAIRVRARLVVGHHNLNGLALMRRYPGMRAYYETCDLAYADGMPVVAIARLFGGRFVREHRITSLDFIDSIFREAADRGWVVFYLGSSHEIVNRAAVTFRTRHPRLMLSVRSGYFTADDGHLENEEVIAEINQASPDILIVGMGMPRQEEWLWRNARALNARVLFPIGALADYVAGAIPTPPRWAGRWGMEWLFRLIAEPRRLTRRYLVDPWTLIGPLAKEWMVFATTGRRQRTQGTRERK